MGEIQLGSSMWVAYWTVSQGALLDLKLNISLLCAATAKKLIQHWTVLAVAWRPDHKEQYSFLCSTLLCII